MRTCKKCGQTKPLGEYYEHPTCELGRLHMCKPCARAATRAWHDANPETQRRRAEREREITRERETGQRTCRTCGREKPLEEFTKGAGRASGRTRQCRECRQANQRRLRAAKRSPKPPSPYPPGTKACNKCGVVKSMDDFPRRHNYCKVCRNAHRRAWAKLNHERISDHNHAYRARKRDRFVEPVSRAAIFERDGGICGICGYTVDPNRWDLDHIVPLARGGTHEPANVQVTHPRCNMVKKVSPLEPQMDFDVVMRAQAHGVDRAA